ncbi:hypothetical protein [Nocardia asiatica]|uniref:hypothetical protein n=1 Tax=Nocardia asiatica TaxID=209252 RepID=UPI003EDF57D2
MPIVACRAPAPHAVDPPRERRSRGEVRPEDVLERAEDGPGNDAVPARTRIIDRSAPVADLSDAEPS